jgi:hypothetical protein
VARGGVQPVPAAIAGNLARVHYPRTAGGVCYLYIRCSVGACPGTVPATLRFLRRRRVGHVPDVVRGILLLPLELRQDRLPELKCLSMRGSTQASDHIAIARKIAELSDFPRW